MRISEVEDKVPPEVFALAKTDKFFQLAIDVLAKARDLAKMREAGETPPLSEKEYESVVFETMRRIGVINGLDPAIVYRACMELEWQRYRTSGIDADLAEIDAMLDAGDYDAASARIKDSRLRWRSKRFNKLSAKLKTLIGS